MSPKRQSADDLRDILDAARPEWPVSPARRSAAES